jgi:hypothetical protein
MGVWFGVVDCGLGKFEVDGILPGFTAFWSHAGEVEVKDSYGFFVAVVKKCGLSLVPSFLSGINRWFFPFRKGPL